MRTTNSRAFYLESSLSRIRFPMTRQYFYTDTLAAAFMAKHFKMRFGCRYESGEFNGNPGMGALHRWQEIVRWNEFAGPIYIHPDSERLLGPAIGDLIHNGCCSNYYVVAEEYIPDWSASNEVALAHAKKWFESPHARIVQRGEKPFFWPEREAA